MRRIGFYPCCAKDVKDPYDALAEIVDEIVFCDVSPKLSDDPSLGFKGPARTFWRMDVHEAIDKISHIDVLFYRRDGTSEGGSGIFVLGKHVLPKILKKMTGSSCHIITDGSNSRGGTFRKMKRKAGLILDGRHIKLREEQRFGHLGALEFDVSPETHPMAHW